MNNALTLNLSNGMALTLSPATDARIAHTGGGSLVAVSANAARALVAELCAWGLNASSDRELVTWCSAKGLAA